MNTLGLKIRKVREIRNISQDYIANKLGISQSAYSSIENGRTKINDSKLKLISEILEVDSDIIKNFNEQVVFNSCSQSGFSNVYNIQSIEKIQELYEKLIIEKDNRISFLEKELEKKTSDYR